MAEILSFTLGPIGLGSILMLLESEGASGVLEAEGGVRIEFAEGQIAGARCGPLERVEALRTIFLLRDLRFVFSSGPLPDAKPMISVVRAVLDSARVQDEWARIGPLVARPNLDLETAPAPLRPLLRLLDGRRSIARAVLMLGVSPAMVVDGLLELLERGALASTGPPETPEPWPGLRALRGAAAPAGAEGAPSALDEEFERLIDEGRQQLRAGDLERAEQTFNAALSLRPDDRIAAQNLRRVRQLRER